MGWKDPRLSHHDSRHEDGGGGADEDGEDGDGGDKSRVTQSDF